MFDSQPDLKKKVLGIRDIQGMTLLHRAAMFDHIDVCAYLLEAGIDIDVCDNNKRTALLLAATECSLQSVRYLLSCGASILLRDIYDRNLLHYIIIKQLNVKEIAEQLFSRHNYHLLFDQRDRDGFCPVHYASKDGQLSILQFLIKMGAEIGNKTNQRQSPLHFAAQYGRYNTCKQLLDTTDFKRIINEQDHLGQTPLHLSSQNGHTNIVELLLHRGALFIKTYDGNSPLHEAAANGHINTIRSILQTHSHLVNVQNLDGQTPLHRASYNGHPDCVTLLLYSKAEFLKDRHGDTFVDLAIEQKQKDVCLAIIAHDRWKEAFDLPCPKYRTPLLGLIEHLPECVSVG
ncbi:unnamed protein product [Didymodactylos carnosus]|nr:unnamed protein product [Didymodactylos carnosus]CAF4008681.1 unnamed protein product [Didymodactylos carnosus]